MALLPLLSLTLVSFAPVAAPAQDSVATRGTWPQWDGPDRSGISKATDWSSEGKEEPLWTAELGLGYSTVVVQDGRLVTMGYDQEKGLDTVFCFDARSGEALWSHSYPSAIWNRAHEGGTVNTPSFDGDRVFSLNREGNLFCFDAEDGEILWHVMLKPEENPHELEYPVWGFSASPLVLEDRLILNCGRLMAVDKEDGSVLWASDDYGHGYATPIQFEHEGERVLATMNNAGLGIVTQENGIELFRLEMGGKNRGIHAATPVRLGADLFVSAATKPGCARVSIADDELAVVWENRSMVNTMSGCVRMKDHLFGFHGSVLACLDEDGDQTWSERGIGNGAVMGAGDRLLIMGGTGELIVAEANPEKYVELSRRPVFEAGRYWTKPILVDGIVYCRSSKGAFAALDHRVEKSGG